MRAERDRAEGRFYLDNWGADSIGPVRAQLIGDFNGLLGYDDRLTIGGVMTPLEPEEFALLRAGYSNRLGRSGTEASLSGYVARSRAGPRYGDLGGDSAEGSAGLAHLFHRSRGGAVRGELDFTYREAIQDQKRLRIRRDRLAMLSASVNAFGKVGPGRGRARIALVQGLDLLGATEQGDLLASRADADGTFTKLEAWLHYDQSLGGRFSMQFQAEGQVASGGLLASEEIGLGGRYLLRGYDYRERSGDDGIAAMVELRYDLETPQPFKAAQLFAFADAGIVDNHGGFFGDGSLASAGGGVRLSLGKVEGSIELGVPLKRRIGGGRSPRLSFTLGTRF
jgi:hemolysin activation/secretion protein